MSITVLRGYDGTIAQGASATALVAIQSWEATATQDVEEQGPFLNDSGHVYPSRTAKRLKGTFKGIVPSGKDTSQTAVKDALINGTDIRMAMTSVGGYSVIVETALIEELKLGQDAKGTGTFEGSFRDNGGFLIL